MCFSLYNNTSFCFNCQMRSLMTQNWPNSWHKPTFLSKEDILNQSLPAMFEPRYITVSGDYHFNKLGWVTFATRERGCKYKLFKRNSFIKMASVVLRCASKSLSSTLQSIAARRVLNVQVQAVRSYHLSRNLLGGNLYMYLVCVSTMLNYLSNIFPTGSLTKLNIKIIIDVLVRF